MAVDIEIDSNMGFYHIYGASDAGRDFITENVEGGEQGSAYSDDGRLVRDIADGAVDDGLEVTWNNQPYSQVA